MDVGEYNHRLLLPEIQKDEHTLKRRLENFIAYVREAPRMSRFAREREITFPFVSDYPTYWFRQLLAIWAVNTV